VTMQLDPSALRGLTPRDQSLFAQFGVGPTATAPHRRLQQAFEARAAEQPQAEALVHLGASMSYGELDLQAERLADLLVESGVRPGERVGLFLERSIPMVVGILAVLKAGAVYVPQDIRITPAYHLAHVIGTAGIRVVLTLSRFADRLPGGLRVISVDEFLRGHERVSPRPKPSQVDASAVVIFTSGTTGKPNGVKIGRAHV
jgi:D-alanine--poly(phosphoribitol) ligase subunit 1